MKTGHGIIPDGKMTASVRGSHNPVTNSGPYVSLPNLPELISVISASQSLIWVTHSQRASSTSHTHTREHTHTPAPSLLGQWLITHLSPGLLIFVSKPLIH